MSVLSRILSRTPDEVFSDLAMLFMYVIGFGAALVVFALLVGMAIWILRLAIWGEDGDGGDE